MARHFSRSVRCQYDHRRFDYDLARYRDRQYAGRALGAFLINHFANGPEVFTRQQDTLKFMLLAVLLSTTVSATLGVTSLSLAGYAEWDAYSAIWITWWLGDAVGALIVTPAIVLWVSEFAIKWSRRHLLEMGVSLTLLCLITVMVFHSGQAMTAPHYPLGFLTLSILIWIAVRLGSRATATAILLCVGIAIWGTLRGFGPFARGSPNESLLMLQAFMAVIAVTALALTVGVSEQKRARRRSSRANNGSTISPTISIRACGWRGRSHRKSSMSILPLNEFGVYRPSGFTKMQNSGGTISIRMIDGWSPTRTIQRLLIRRGTIYSGSIGSCVPMGNSDGFILGWLSTVPPPEQSTA